MSGELLAALAAQVGRLEQGWEPAVATDPGMLATARQLAAVTPDDEVATWHLLGTFYEQRARALYTPEDVAPWFADWDAMLEAFTRCFLADADVPEGLRATVAEYAAGRARELMPEALNSPDATTVTGLARLWQRIVAATPVDSKLRAGYLCNLGLVLRYRYDRSADLADLDGAVSLGQEAVDTAVADDDDLPLIVYDLAVTLFLRFQAAPGNLGDLDAAIAGFQRAAQILPADDPRGWQFWNDLGSTLRIRFENTGQRRDLDAAIIAGTKAIVAAPGEGVLLANLFAALLNRYGQDGDQADLEEAIAVARRAADSAAAAQDDAFAADCLANLGQALCSRAVNYGDRSRLEESIAVGRRSVAATADAGVRARCEFKLGNSLLAKIAFTGDYADLDEAVGRMENAVALTAGGGLGQQTYLAALGGALRLRAEQSGDLADLDRAVTVIRQAVDTTPGGNPSQATYLYDLCLALGDRHVWTGTLGDAKESLAAAKRMLRAVPEGHPSRGAFLAAYAGTLRLWCEAANRFDELPEVIEVSRRAIAALPEGHANYLSARSVLAGALSTRFQQTKTDADLDAAITACRSAVEAAGAGRADGGQSRAGLAGMVRFRYDRTGDADDLEAAIALLRESLGLTAAPIDQADRKTELARALRLRYQRTGDAADLAEAVTLSREAAEAIPVGYTNAGVVRFGLAAAMNDQFRQGEAGRERQEPAPGPAADAGARAPAVLIAAMSARVERFTADDHSSVLGPGAVDEAQRLAELLSAADSEDLDAWETAGLFYWMRAIALPTDADEDRERAVEAAVGAYLPLFLAGRTVPKELLAAVAAEALDAAGELANRAEATGDLSLIDQLIGLTERIRDSMPPDDPDRARNQYRVGTVWLLRFNRTGDLAELGAAIADIERGIGGTPADHPGYAVMLGTHSDALRRRFERAGDPADLDQAISEIRAAEAITPPDNPYLANMGAIAGMALLLRFQCYGGQDTADLDAAVDVLTRAAQVPGADPGAAAACQSGLSQVWRFRYEVLGDSADLDRAIDRARESLARAPAGHLNRAACLNELGTALALRAERSGQRADFDAAVEAAAQAIAELPEGHPARPPVLNTLGNARLARFDHFGDPADLDAAVTASRQALAGLPAGHGQHAAVAGGLSSALLTRYMATGDLSALDQSIDLGRQLVSAAAGAPGTQALSTFMHWANTAFALRLRYERTDQVADLAEAIELLRSAVAAVPDGHRHRPRYLGILSMALLNWCGATEDAAGLAEATEAGRRALAEAAPADPLRSWLQATLATALRVRYEVHGRLADLTESTALLTAAEADTREGNADKGGLQSSLGNSLRAIFDRTGYQAARTAAIDAFRRGARTAPQPSIRIGSARGAADLLAATAPEQAADLLEMAVRLLPQTASRQLGRADRQHQLSAFAFLASDAAAAALTAGGPGAPARALGLLELGRAVLHGQALDTRTDLTELHTIQPALARRFTELRGELEAPLDDPVAALAVTASGPLSAAGRPPGRDRHVVAAEFAGLLGEIRRVPGFESFLLPPGPEQLTRQAARGPIAVYNVSRSRSDALLITADGITQLPLPALSHAAVTSRADAFNAALGRLTERGYYPPDAQEAEDVLSETLEWLWDAAAEPVLARLGYDQPPAPGREWPRVWWATGGLLGLLPLHAAGYHRDPGPARTVLDRVISSYTPTVRALGYARDREGTSSPARSLVVAMPSTPQQASLPGVRAEATRLRALLPSPTVLIADDDAVASPDEPAPTKDAVLARLPEAGIAHFCCHGLSIPDDPSRSFLLLTDYREDPLTVASLTEIRLHRAQLAYLSACQTARNASPELLDEAIHLASAFQLAGYPHVIGTLWSVWDTAAQDIVGTFYGHLETGPRTFDTRASAVALHHAVRGLRGGPGPQAGLDRTATPSFWAPFLHTGA